MTTATAKQRIQSIDIVRGIIIIIMTLDHVRDYFHIHAFDEDPLKLNPPDTIIFLTRWITHYCAPTFVFLSGVSAWLAGQKRTKRQLSAFLLKRGAWLICADLLLMAFAFTLNPSYNLLILEVLWAIGIGMIVLGLMVNTSMTVIIAIGLIIFLGHNLIDYVPLPAGGWGVAISALLSGRGTPIPLGGGRLLLVGYSPFAWVGILLLGYVGGQLYSSQKHKYTPAQRQKILLVTGLVLTGLFFILRFINKYGDPSPWAQQQTRPATVLSFINTSKYPPSLMFSCMTLGPVLILLALAEKMQGRFAMFALTYGKVPFFYFIVHFYLVRLLTVIVFFATGHTWAQRIDPNLPFNFRPQHFGYNIWIVYLIWISVVLALYYPCRWFSRLKATKDDWWLSYV